MHSEHEHHPEQQKPPEDKSWWLSPSGIITIIFIALIGYYLIAEHRVHITQFFGGGGIFLLILLCPLMHFFMHGSHGGHEGHQHLHKKDTNEPPEKKD